MSVRTPHRIDQSPVTALDLARTQWLDPSERQRMAERLYRAVLTASSHDSDGPSARSGFWPAVTRTWVDCLGALEAGPGETDTEAQDRVAHAAPKPRYQPSARDLSVWIDDLSLLSGYGTETDQTGAELAVAMAEARLAELKQDLAALRARKSGIEGGSIPCATSNRSTALRKLGQDTTDLDMTIGRQTIRLEKLVHARDTEVRASLRQALGVLKGAAMHWWIGAGAFGVSRWKRAGSYGACSPSTARQVHDRAVSFALVRDQRARDLKASRRNP
jgi:hypothetical protein